MKPEDKAKLEALLIAAKAAGVEVTEKGPGHFHLRGASLVNYYPFSKDRTAFSPRVPTAKHVTPEVAVAMALETAPDAPPPESYFTIFGRPVTEAEFRKHEMPAATEAPWNLPWKRG